MGNYLILNDVNSNTITGLLIQNLPPISKPRQRVNIEEIDGRDGDIITPLGYGAYDKEFQIGLSYNYDVDEIIKYFDSEGKVTFSNEPDKYYNYKIIDQIDFEKLIRFKTATVKMHVQPFKYANNEEAITDEFDPITAEGKSMSLNNTVPNTFNEFSIHGNSEQDKTNGYQLLHDGEATKTMNGITFTKNSDGSVLVNGTATANASYDFFNKEWTEFSAGDYVLTGCPGVGSGSTYRLVAWKEGWSPVGIDIGTGSGVNLAENTKLRVQIVVASGITMNNLLFKPMLEKGTTKHSYEPYTGGQAAPSPDYSFEIHSTGDNVNLFDITTAINGYIKPNGEVSANNDWKLSQHIEVKNISSYTMSRSDGTRQSFVIAEYDENKTFIKRNEQGLQPVGVNSPYTITTGATTKYIRINYNNTFQATTIKLEKGSKATPYTPYGMGSVNEKVQNKNLFDKTDYEQGYDYEGTTKKANTNWGITYFKSVANKSYTISGLKAYSGTSIVQLDENKKAITPLLTRSNSKTEYTVTATQDGYIAVSFVWRESASQGSELDTMMIELGSTATDYIAHEEQNISIPCQQPMRAIGEYKDTFVKVDGNWYERHYIKSKILDGSETYSDFRTWGNYYRININIADAKTYSINNSNGQLSSHFHYNHEGVFAENTQSIPGIFAQFRGSTGFYFVIGQSSMEDFKTWLSNNNVELIYVLATPVDLPCTEEQTQVLESKKHSYDGQTHISSLDATPAHMKVAVNGDTSLTVRNEGNIYSKPVFTISGSGDISMYLNNSQVFEISLGDEEYITIDIDKMEAYKGSVLKNRLVKGNYENCVLETGDNTISFTGAVTGIEISNYSRWI